MPPGKQTLVLHLGNTYFLPDILTSSSMLSLFCPLTKTVHCASKPNKTFYHYGLIYCKLDHLHLLQMLFLTMKSDIFIFIFQQILLYHSFKLLAAVLLDNYRMSAANDRLCIHKRTFFFFFFCFSCSILTDFIKCLFCSLSVILFLSKQQIGLELCF